MGVLQVLEGSCPGEVLELQHERIVLGRHPNCHIVLDNAAVSRHHAQILESHGSYYVEDLRSRNGTFLNEDPVEGRQELFEADTIKICEMLFRFHLTNPPPEKTVLVGTVPMDERSSFPDEDSSDITALESGSQLLAVGDEAQDGFPEQSSVISTLEVGEGSSWRLGVKPEIKLRAILELSDSLGRVLRLEEVLPKILEGLFQIFPQADEGFVVLRGTDRDKLVVQSIKTRSQAADSSVPVSTTIIKRAMYSGEALLSTDATRDNRFQKSESLSQFEVRSIMCVPLMGKSREAFGVIQIDTRDLGRQFSQDDLDLLTSVASQAAMAVEYARLHEELLKQRDLERDLEFATQVQLGFLPSERPRLDEYEFFGFCGAAHRVGGDYFDYVNLPEGKVGVALGDVAGKGIPAALLMARLYSTARYQMLSRSTADAALSGLNTDLACSGLGHRFITAVMAFLDPQKHEVAIANAGHMAPLLREANHNVFPVAQSESGLPLGITPDEQFRETKVALHPGDSLIFYTDGITEAMNLTNDIYHRTRLTRCIQQGPDEIEPLIKEILADVEEFCQEQAQRDDMCLVGLRRRPQIA